jgi:hypothetical protein
MTASTKRTGEITISRDVGIVGTVTLSALVYFAGWVIAWILRGFRRAAWRHRATTSLGLAIAGHWPDHWHGFEAMALIMSNTQESRYMLILAMLLLALAIGLASSRTCAAEAESVPIQDLNKGDPNKGCAGENSYLRNGTCWQRVITDPRFKS